MRLLTVTICFLGFFCGWLTSSNDNALNSFDPSFCWQLAKADLDGSDVLCSGCLVVRSATLGMGPVVSWVPDESNGGAGTKKEKGVVCGSLNDREWTVVSSDTTAAARSTSGVALSGGGTANGSTVTVRPIVVEVSDIKSFRLSEDGNQLTLIQNDGTKHPPLIFLDEGPEALIQVFQK